MVKLSFLRMKVALTRRRPLGERVVNAVATFSLALMSPSALALNLVQYEHTSWGAKDGLGGAVIWTSQVPNGMLLLRTSNGYQVFDGIEFHSYGRDTPPPFVDNASALGQRSPTGAIYFIDPMTKNLMRSLNNRTDVVEDKEKSSRWTTRFVFDTDGIGWFAAPGHLYRLDGLKVENVGARMGIPIKARLSNAIVDRLGTVWVGTQDDTNGGALYYLPKAERTFRRFADSVECFPAALAPDGSIWCANDSGLTVVTVENGRPIGRRLLSKDSFGWMVFDSHGGFWIAFLGSILHAADWRTVVEAGGMDALHAEKVSVKEGLSSDAIGSIAEDTAGSIWIGTNGGLDRFRATAITPFKLPRLEWGSALVGDADGSLWAGNWDGSLMHIVRGRIEDVPAVSRITALRRDERDRIWVAGAQGVWRKETDGSFIHIEHPPGTSMSWLRDLGEDDAGAMWFQPRNQLLRLQDGQWSTPEGPSAPPPETSYTIFADAQKQLWFAGGKRGPFVLKGGALREIKSQAFADTVALAYVGYARGRRVWVGGAGGVGAFIGDDFYPLKLKDNVAKAITGIVETAQGELWLHGLNKAFRIPRDQVNAALRGQLTTPEILDFRDGLRAATSPVEPLPTLIEDASGLLWFSTTQGLFWIDPASRKIASSKPPLTVIRSLKSDGKFIQAGVSTLPANPHQIEFGYVAAALGVSDRVQFRYRLEGFDSDWQEAGTRRTAYYTKLPPGRYRFEVVASNEQGQWADEASSMSVEVLPAWYQTFWFRALVALLALGFLWSIYLLRVNVLSARERFRLREILAERERIARDLHDTLLQSMQGVILGFQGLASAMPEQNETRLSIEGQLDRADHLLGEARDRVRDLRSTGADALSLREALELAAMEVTGTATREVVEEGEPRVFRPLARDFIYFIGREALLNAVEHSEGSAVKVKLQFGQREFVLGISDNGVGLAPEIVSAGARPGHYGLIGMRERAGQLGADFSLASVAEGGTTVELRVPAARAYVIETSHDVRGALRQIWRFVLSRAKRSSAAPAASRHRHRPGSS